MLTKQEQKHWNLIKGHLIIGNTEPARSWLRESPTKAAAVRRSKAINRFVISNNLDGSML